MILQAQTTCTMQKPDENSTRSSPSSNDLYLLPMMSLPPDEKHRLGKANRAAKRLLRKQAKNQQIIEINSQDSSETSDDNAVQFIGSQKSLESQPFVIGSVPKLKHKRHRIHHRHRHRSRSSSRSSSTSSTTTTSTSSSHHHRSHHNRHRHSKRRTYRRKSRSPSYSSSSRSRGSSVSSFSSLSQTNHKQSAPLVSKLATSKQQKRSKNAPAIPDVLHNTEVAAKIHTEEDTQYEGLVASMLQQFGGHTNRAT